MSFRDMAHDGGYRDAELDQVAALLEEEERERLDAMEYERGIVERCTCGSTRPDRDGQRDQVVNSNCMAHAVDPICAHAGHDFEPAGGGLLICTTCEMERWL